MEYWQKNLYIIWFTQVISLTGFGFVFPFLPLFIQELGVTDPGTLKLWTGLISAAPALGMGIMAPIWGILADRYGNRLMILRAMAAGVILNVVCAFSVNAFMVLIIRCLQGVFCGTVSAAAALVAKGTPENKLPFALGFLSSSTFIGVFIGPLIGGIAAECFGYRASFVFGSAVLFTGFILALLFLKEPERKEGTSGKDVMSRDHKGVYERTPANFTSGFYIWGFVMLFFLRYARTLTIPFLSLHLQNLRGSVEGTSAVTGVASAFLGIATAASGLTLTRLKQHKKPAFLINVLFLASAITVFPVFLLRDTGLFIIFSTVFSYFLGGIEPMIQAALSRNTPKDRRGFLFGIQTTVSNVGWFIAPLTGSLISILFSIRFVYLAQSLVLGAAFITSLLLGKLSSCLVQK